LRLALAASLFRLALVLVGRPLVLRLASFTAPDIPFELGFTMRWSSG